MKSEDRAAHFCKLVARLETADFALARENYIYRLGIFSTCAFCESCALKMLADKLKDGDRLTPLEIALRAKDNGWIPDASRWLKMRSDLYDACHTYDVKENMEWVLDMVEREYLPELLKFRETHCKMDISEQEK